MRSLIGAAVLALAIPNLSVAESDFIRGDANVDGLRNLADAVYSLAHLFQDGPTTCRDAIDANDDGELDIADPVYLLMNLFAGGAAIPEPVDWCGADPTPDAIDCGSNQTCDLGGPIEGLTEAELESFNRGRDVMRRRFKPNEGLGPFYNTTSCVACHETPVIGGSSPIYRNFFLIAIGDPGGQMGIPGLPSMVLPSYHDLDLERPSIPASTPGAPVVAAHRNGPPLFGTGLFEFVSNATILSHADPNDIVTPDGISGRFNTDGLGHIGRFGFKSQANFIEAFIRGAANNQMGITTDPIEGSMGTVSLSMKQISSTLDDPTTDSDGIPDPEISTEDFADLINFCRFIRPPFKKLFGPEEVAGELAFEDIGCALCHVPFIASDYGPLEAYTDLLLHDIGTGDGLSQGIPQFSTITPATTENEFRTAPLWGVSLHAPFFHDGSADTLLEAITRHSGEAEGVKQAFLALPPGDQDNIIRFLEAL